MTSTDDDFNSTEQSNTSQGTISGGEGCWSSSEDFSRRHVDLPERVFATDRYPVDRRVNGYSKPEYLIDILDILDGTPEYDIVVKSPLGPLFSLPARRCSMSGKLVHNFLCRQLHCENSEDLWFTFGGWPLRFSLTEFKKITGLLCGSFPAAESIEKAKQFGPTGCPYWYTLIGPNKNTTIADIVDLLKQEKRMLGWRRLQLVLIVIVEGILICETQPARPSFEKVEMVKDVGFFLSYPWGRISFDLTIEMIKVGKKLRTRSQLVEKLKQSSVALHGFPISIQLFIFESVPLLLRFLPHSADCQPFLSRTVRRLRKLRAYHTGNILLVENEKELLVRNLCEIALPVDSEPCLRHLKMLIDNSEPFTKEVWPGGDTSLPRLCICVNRKKNSRCRCGSGYKRTSIPHDKSVMGKNNFISSACKSCKKLERSFRRLCGKMESDRIKLREDILAEVELLISGRKHAEVINSNVCESGETCTVKKRRVARLPKEIPQRNATQSCVANVFPRIPSLGQTLLSTNIKSAVVKQLLPKSVTDLQLGEETAPEAHTVTVHKVGANFNLAAASTKDAPCEHAHGSADSNLAIVLFDPTSQSINHVPREQCDGKGKMDCYKSKRLMDLEDTSATEQLPHHKKPKQATPADDVYIPLRGSRMLPYQ